MRQSALTHLTWALAFMSVLISAAAYAGARAPSAASSSDQDLPEHISWLTHFGERADFSPGGQCVLFVEKTFGDVYEVDPKAKMPRLLTGFYPNHGSARALYLASGDILLSGPVRFDPGRPGDARTQCFLSILKKDLIHPPTLLGTKCSEGPAVSRRRMHIAFTHAATQYPQELPAGSSRMYEADITEESSEPRLANQRLVLDSRSLPFRCTLETQNLRPPEERELIFSAYGYDGTGVCGLDLSSGMVTNYSQVPDQYDEPEEIFPDGRFTCVESDRDNQVGKKGAGFIDIWKLALDGSDHAERLTYFARYPG